jgi:hypothetical protein
MAKISLNQQGEKLKKIVGTVGSNVAIKRQWNNGGSLKKEVNPSTTTKKEAVPTSCRFEKPAASPKDYFYWLTQFFVVQCSISCVPDAVTN